jgi:hypothetical protein
VVAGHEDPLPRLGPGASLEFELRHILRLLPRVGLICERISVSGAFCRRPGPRQTLALLTIRPWFLLPLFLLSVVEACGRHRLQMKAHSFGLFKDPLQRIDQVLVVLI